jgi:hypothetical protein
MRRVVYRVDDAIVADAHAVTLHACQLYAPVRARVVCQTANLRIHPPQDIRGKARISRSADGLMLI